MHLVHRISSPFRWLVRFIRRWKYPLIGLATITALVWWYCLPEDLFEDPTSTVLTDHEGNILGARIASDGQWRFPERSTVPYKFKQAIIQFEDRRFYNHMGFSMKAFGRALVQNAKAGRVVSGGSTISMQTIRLSRKGKARSIWEKCVEVFQATRMEIDMSKDEILALYASHAPMGGNVVGLDAAAWRYFGRRAEDLSWAETCVLAILPNAPGLIHPGKNRKSLLEKRNRLLDRLYAVGELNKMEWQLAKSEPIPDPPDQLPNLAPHLMDRHIGGAQQGKWVTSTIDADIQEDLNALVERHHAKLAENEIHNAAVMVMDVETGNVVAYIGNTQSEDSEHGNSVDIIRAPRSTGSILKPFLYACMIEDGEIMPHQLVEDVPTVISGYAPKNYNDTYDGMVPASQALSRSLNIPILHLLQQHGVQKFRKQLKDLGFTTLHRPAAQYGLSLVLGGAEVSLWDLCAVYGNMARKLNSAPGEDPDFLIPVVQDIPVHMRKRDRLMLSRATIWTTFEAMLEVVRPGADAQWQHFNSSQKIAWKTGTSYGFRDAWAVGVTPKYVVGVWVGNADGEGRPGLVGIQAAAPILFDVFARLPQSEWFPKPIDEMVPVAVSRQSGFRASQYCEQVDTLLVPKTCLNTTACPYHKPISLNRAGTHRVSPGSPGWHNRIEENHFVLPPMVEQYYRKKNPNYRPLPPFEAGSVQNDNDNPIAIVYPKSLSTVHMPVDLDGSVNHLILDAVHRHKGATLYWHLNDRYLGSTDTYHEMHVVPSAGEQILTVIDDQGNQMSRSFTVLGVAH